MRLVLDVAKTDDGRYEGRLTVAGTGAKYHFAGILELLAILEEQFGPEEAPYVGREKGTGLDRVTDEAGSS